MLGRNLNCVWVIFWTIIVFNSTHEIYLAGNKYLPYLRNSINKSGLVGHILNRGRDDSNLNWGVIRDIYFGNHLLLLFGYVLFSWTFKSRWNFVTSQWNLISPILSLLYVWTCSRSTLVVLIFCFLPLSFWLIQCLKFKPLSWICSLGFLYMAGQSLFFDMVLRNIEDIQNMYLINSSLGWSVLRCISFSMDMIDQHSPSNFESLMDTYKYTYYFPLFTFGPFVDFGRFKMKLHKNELGSKFPFSWLFKILIWVLISEISIHFLYFQYLASEPLFLQRQNGWALFAILYWLTQSFWLTVGVTYEFPSLVAITDGVQMYNLSPCPGHMHKYSRNWRTLDPGLYKFLVKYIYSPVLFNLSRLQLNNNANKFIASGFTFLFIVTYHGASHGIIIRGVINFIVATLESYTNVLALQIKIWRESGEIPHPLFCSTWEFLGLPLIEGVLAIVSMLSNVIFIVDYNAGDTMTRLIISRGYWIFFILAGYCFARTGNVVN